ncbi:family 2 glycosyltransferase [Cryphonectria parasitica EP155]|uniref:dolichyl-phosphate beta-glucosyltransferase n=1 Tax=Cryphonectria parasitica (strain ATCC 38755 / EP155) TaxID=660469 RepID=A0A9P5CQU1_CRYP1|nr:family 2 glycosyltransferase [Cryphonectria parasitica EP155]KAF3767869.1 family 2 glycosyltransferase [Cryphonectria parasitica EP155]
MASGTLTAQLLSVPEQLIAPIYTTIKSLPLYVSIIVFTALVGLVYLTVYTVLHLIAPKPRAPLPSEKTYITTNPDGSTSEPRPLPCWFDRWLAERQLSESPAASDDAFHIPDTGSIEPAKVEVSVVIPAYNEEKRIIPALEEAIEYLDTRFGRPTANGDDNNNNNKRRRLASPPATQHHRQVFRRSGKKNDKEEVVSGYEILIVNDGSTDSTVDVALEFSRKHGLHDILRIVTLEKNRGKGGGVTHGFRHVRGAYIVFADADGASRFSDLGKLIEGCEDVVDASSRGVAIGSRGHLVGSEAVVKRSALRNFLMKSFHTVIKILTPPATSRIRDTQCGFKLFSRAALPHIIPYMHAEGWIFDIEMLMLAESAPPTSVLAIDGTVIGSSSGIRVAEVPIDWHEVDGSKMNLIKDSLSMALGLAVLRFSWMLGVYRRRTT